MSVITSPLLRHPKSETAGFSRCPQIQHTFQHATCTYWCMTLTSESFPPPLAPTEYSGSKGSLLSPEIVAAGFGVSCTRALPELCCNSGCNEPHTCEASTGELQREVVQRGAALQCCTQVQGVYRDAAEKTASWCGPSAHCGVALS